MIRKFLRSFVLSLTLLATLSASAYAQSTPNPSGTGNKCPSAHLFEGLFNKICWSCVFPVFLFGRDAISAGDYDPPIVKFLSMPSAPESAGAPDGHVTAVGCFCGDLLHPKPGMSVGFWAPVRVIEVVREYGCSPALGGVSIFKDPLMVGTPKPPTRGKDGTQKIYMNYNDYVFPLMKMIGMFVNLNCNMDGYASMDMATSSMFDPSASRDDIALIMDPEAFAVGNPYMLAACAIDGIRCTVDPGYCLSEMRNKQFWCAGTWGNLTPYTDNVAHSGSPPRDTSLIATRILAKWHRIGRLVKSYGKNAQCPETREYSPMLPKSQYKMQMIFPVAEASDRCCHHIGESTYKWGEWRNLPGFEDYLYMVWRWSDCCLSK